MKLRLGGIQHLGQVKGAYVESSGDVSIFTYPADKVISGLPVIPPWDVKPPKFFVAAKDLADKEGYSCIYCGNIIRIELNKALPVYSNCGKMEWSYTWDSMDEHGDFDTMETADDKA